MKNPILKTAIGLVVLWFVLEFVLPLFTAPLPFSLTFMYLAIALGGIMIFVTLSGTSTEAFMEPIGRFISGEGQVGVAKTARVLVLILVPFLVGWVTYGRLAPSDQPPPEGRTIHPAPPVEFVGLANPLSPTPDNIQAGKGFFAAMCSPCHGGNFDGKGPAAKGFSPPPANFVDSGTIAQLQESYVFWRIKKGGVGLPVEGMPWKSAMPRWEFELTDEQIWKVIMGEYDGAGHKPRTWEEEE